MKQLKCLDCDKPLTKYTRSVIVRSIDDVPASMRKFIVRETKSIYRGCLDLTIWTGRLGRYADNRFCGLRCAAHYARMHTERRSAILPAQVAEVDAMLETLIDAEADLREGSIRESRAEAKHIADATGEYVP